VRLSGRLGGQVADHRLGHGGHPHLSAGRKFSRFIDKYGLDQPLDGLFGHKRPPAWLNRRAAEPISGDTQVMLEYERRGTRGMAEPDPEVPLRKLPVAERNAIRVSRILDATGLLVAERGYEKMTTSQVALRAGVSPGVLYRFFADKREIMHALAARNLDRYLARVEDAIRSGGLDDWPATADASIDLFVAMCREDPGFLVVRFGDVADVHLLGATDDNDSHLAGRLAGLLAAEHGDRPDLPTERALVIAIKIADALVKYAFTVHPDGDDAIIQHAKELVRIHLQLAGSEAGSDSGTGPGGTGPGGTEPGGPRPA
jgi:AcrR family transcriptional regulator